jgi:hypothetical protein
MPKKQTYMVVQQGGSSSELYLHASGSRRDAENFRKDCEKAAYQTSEVFTAPDSVTQHPGFWEAADDILRAAANLQ